MSTIKVNNIIPNTGNTVNIYGISITDGVLSAATYENLPIVEFTGGTVSDLTATTISATTYENLPIVEFTGGTVDGETIFNNGLLATTISATTYENLPIVEFTGGTVSGLTATTISATTYYGDGSNLTGINVGHEVITVTKEDLDVIIANKQLIAGSTYKILDVDVDLYGGTTIFLRALTNDKLSVDGEGIFYNPKYNETPIWNKYINYTIANKIGDFSYEETIVSNTNAYGYLKTYGMIEWVSGDWSGTTSISGLTSSATAEIEAITYPDYDLGSEVIWGGKKWVNISGKTINITNEVISVANSNILEYCFNLNRRPLDRGTLVITDGVETFTDNGVGQLIGDFGGYGNINYDGSYGCVIFNSAPLSGVNITATYTSTTIGYDLDNKTLSDVWESVGYNDIDYNVVLDEIEYDIVHDIIIARKDRFNNIVSGNYLVFSELMNGLDLGNPIKDFQWGNGNDDWGYVGGLYNFSDKIDGNNGISDGGDDMYDGGNEIYTNLDNVPYTHTRLEIQPDGGVPANLFPKDGQVVSGDTYFGETSQYFTNMYPGLFVLQADNISINEFRIDGNIGSDGDGQVDVDEYVLTGYSTTYKVFVKKVYGANDPSINHIIIVNTDDSSILHEYDETSEEDFDKISNIFSATKIYYLLTSTFPGNGYISKSDIDEMVTIFLGLVDGKGIDEALTILNSNYETITNVLPLPSNTNYFGVMGNKVIDSYLDSINFNGGYMWNNRLEQKSYIVFNHFAKDFYNSSHMANNVLINSSFIADNYISNSSSIVGNRLDTNCRINSNRLDSNSDIENNDLKIYSYIDNCSSFDDGDIRGNTLFDDSYINSCFINNNGIYSNMLSTNGRIFNNSMVASEINRNTLKFNAVMGYMTLVQSQVYLNELNGESELYNNMLSGATISHNNLNKNSYINYNTIDALNNGNSKIYKNNLFTSYINGNTITVGSSEISFNDLFDSTIFNNQISNNSSIANNKLKSNSTIDTNQLLTQGYIVKNNLLNASRIMYGKFDTNARVEYCDLTNETIFELSNTPLIPASIRYIIANHGTIVSDLTNATNVYSIASKTLVTNSSNESVLVFIGGDNTQQVVAVNS